ncbi:superoxide dismutase family protein [Jeotgalibacillus sp. S-D1]|uniref:superoxide dismutase family protein n=1 Tax=Jeotgalibacillus sp. S-D1 TaxID=2552189 RepID=UPI001059392D|nr:superoxide dismutase family protein [Jeotgalibacillus sp. S-D1]TDL30843.1 superoxide dismutase family protein [Jeotgalibacillus sp. S-D1]
MKKWFYLILVLTVFLILAACGNGDDTGTEEPSDEAPAGQEDNTEGEMPENVTVELMNQNEQSVGTAELEETDAGVVINLDASDLPSGEFGFHIHENGQCEAPDFESAGGHFNPTDASHGADHEEGPHAGDLPNLTVGEDGLVQEEITAEGVTLETGKENSLLDSDGTALVIHEGTDDYESQPSGDAGDRMICGEISQ